MKQEERRCSFCDRVRSKFEYLFAGFDDVYICDECVKKYMDLLKKCQSRKVKV